MVMIIFLSIFDILMQNKFSSKTNSSTDDWSQNINLYYLSAYKWLYYCSIKLHEIYFYYMYCVIYVSKICKYFYYTGILYYKSIYKREREK